MSRFEIIKKDKRTRARLGILHTPHGDIQTPAYVMVATHAEIRTLTPDQIPSTKTQVVIANTYHLWDRVLKANPASKKKSWVHQQLGVPMPIMTDSGGFQVFSLGAAKDHQVGKVLKRFNHKPTETNAGFVRITEKGAHFKIDGIKKFLSPELSMDIQEKIGADIIFAFDECTSPLHPFAYTKDAMERTHRWALRCLKAHSRQDQLLMGIVQGGRYKSLRTKSAKAIGSMPFGGFGIGGSFGKDEMKKTLASVVPYLPEEKPRHLLGIGRIEDIFIAVEQGIDTFDCVIPTREARHARIWTHQGAYDVRKGVYRDSKKPVENNCGCSTCTTTTRGELRELFKTKNPLAGTLATIHNIWFFNTLVEEIREALARDRFPQLKKKYAKLL